MFDIEKMSPPSKVCISYLTHTDGYIDSFIKNLYSGRLSSIHLKDRHILIPRIYNTIVLYEQKMTIWT